MLALDTQIQHFMEYANILQGIAEVAIGLAGFAGIAAGLGYRAGGRWSLPDRKRLIAVILFGLGTIFACFVPYAIYHLGFENPWRIASTLCLYIPARAFITQYRIIRYSPSGYSRSAMGLLIMMELSIVALLTVVILGFGGQYEFGLYLTSTIMMLSISSFLFYRLLETAFSGDIQSEDSHNTDSQSKDSAQISKKSA